MLIGRRYFTSAAGPRAETFGWLVRITAAVGERKRGEKRSTFDLDTADSGAFTFPVTVLVGMALRAFAHPKLPA